MNKLSKCALFLLPSPGKYILFGLIGPVYNTKTVVIALSKINISRLLFDCVALSNQFQIGYFLLYLRSGFKIAGKCDRIP